MNIDIVDLCLLPEWEVDREGKGPGMEAEVVVRVQDEGPKGAKDLQPHTSTLTHVVNGTPPYPVEGKQKETFFHRSVSITFKKK